MSEQVTEVIQRQVVGELTPTGDGRTIDLRVVPYNVVTRVADPPDFEPYDEEWLPGAFERQLGAPNRVLMNFEHRQGISDVVGRGTELRDRPEGLEGTFRMLSGPDADKALELVNEKVLTGVSLEAEVTRTVREDGIVKRVKARLINVALTRMPAFEGAEVLAVREQPPDDDDQDDDEPPEAAARSAAVDEMLQRVGFEALTIRAVVRTPWSGSASRFADTDAYCRSCLIDTNPAGAEKVQAKCMLPVYEPNGDLNANALSAAAARISQVGASVEQKAQAARRLVRLYRSAKMEPPEALRTLASR
jgi:HK97 family phage prohead protease